MYMIMAYHITQNFSDRKLLQLYGRLFFVIKHLWLLMIDLRIMPVVEIISYEVFVQVGKSMKSALLYS